VRTSQTYKVMNVNTSEKTVHLVGSTSQQIEQTNTISTSETHLSESEQFLFNFRNKPAWVKIAKWASKQIVRMNLFPIKTGYDFEALLQEVLSENLQRNRIPLHLSEEWRNRPSLKPSHSQSNTFSAVSRLYFLPHYLFYPGMQSVVYLLPQTRQALVPI